MNEEIKLNLQDARPNQSVLLVYEGSQLYVELAQESSTPGVLFEDIRLSKGIHSFAITCEASTHNVFGIVFFSQDMREKKLRISRKLPLGASELVISFEVLEEGVYIPAILASLGKLGDSLSIRECSIIRPLELAETPIAEVLEAVASSIEEAVNEQPPAAADIEVLPNTGAEGTPASIAPNIVSAKASKLYFFVGEQRFGIGSFARELSRVLPVELFTDIQQAEADALAKGLPLCVNGFVKKTEELAEKYPGQLHCFWHSSIRGIEMMGELQRYCRFLKAIRQGQVSGYFLNEDEALPIGAHRFWLPFQVSQKQFNVNAPFDFAIPLASPHSLACKDILQTICVLLQGNYSFVMPKWYAPIYDIEALKLGFGSTSRVELFDTKTNPIEQDYFRMAKVYLSISVTDTMPYSCVEALNSGVPFLVSKNVGWARILGDAKGINPILATVTELPAVYESLNKSKAALKYLYEQQYMLLENIAKRNNAQLLKSFFQSDVVEETQLTMLTVTDPTLCFRVLGALRANKYILLKDAQLSLTGGSVGLQVTLCVSSLKREGYKGMDVADIGWFINRYATLFDEATDYEAITWEILQATYTLINVFCKIEQEQKLVPNIALDNVAFLGIDRMGWAFDNISKQVLKATSTQGLSIVKCEYFFILLLLKIFEIKTNIVCFWWRSLGLLAQEAPNSRFAMMLYDHYSWSSNTAELLATADKATVVGVANPRLRQELKGLGVSKPIFVVKDGVDFDIFPLKGANTSGSKFTFGWIGNAGIQKSAGFEGQDFKGFSLIQKALEGTEFAFEYYDVSQSKPMPHTEVFEHFYSKIDCYICASESEGTPNTVFEALACGIPAITTDVGNVQDVIVEGFNGMIVGRSIEEIRAAAYSIASDRDYYTQSSQSIRESVRDFEWGIKVLVWLQLLRYLLK